MFHGVGASGADRTVEANLGGFGWTAIGDFVTGEQNDRVDWAIVRLYDTIAIDDRPPANVASPATGVAYSHQAGGTVLFPANAVQRGNLNGPVQGSPTVLDQLQCVTAPGARRADVGVSGMGVFDGSGDVIGIEWAVEWDGPAQRHTFYAQPMGNVAASFFSKVGNLDAQYRDSQVPPPVGGWPSPWQTPSARTSRSARRLRLGRTCQHSPSRNWPEPSSCATRSDPNPRIAKPAQVDDLGMPGIPGSGHADSPVAGAWFAICWPLPGQGESAAPARLPDAAAVAWAAAPGHSHDRPDRRVCGRLRLQALRPFSRTCPKRHVPDRSFEKGTY